MFQAVEAVLNDLSDSTAGIVGVYQRDAMQPEKREALEKWVGQQARTQSEKHAENRAGLIRFINKVSQRPVGTP